MTHQRRVLRFFRWLAIGNVLFALNAAGVNLYGLFQSGLWTRESEGSTVSRAISAVQFEGQILLFAILVWIASTAAERYLLGQPPGSPSPQRGGPSTT